MKSDLLTRFLGVREQASVRELLRLPLEATPADVVRARDARIAELDAHPQSETPEADEVRLALHAAAAMLLAEVVPSSHARAVALPPSHAASDEQLAMLEADVIRSIGACGGWSKDALRRIVHHAHTLGIGAEDVAPAIRSATRRRAAPRHQSAQAAPATTMAHSGTARAIAVEQADHHAEVSSAAGLWASRVIAIVAGVAAILVLFSAVNLAQRMAADKTPKQVSDDATPTVDARAPIDRPLLLSDDGVSTRPTPAYVPDQRQDLRDPALVLRELEAAAAGFDLDPASSGERALAAARAFAGRWPAFSREQRAGVQARLARFTGASARRPDVQRAVIAPLLAEASATQEALDNDGVHAIGFAVLLAWWPADGLAPDLRTVRAAALGQAGVAAQPNAHPEFTELALAAAQRLALRLDLGDAEGVERFASAVLAADAEGKSSDAVQSILLDVIERWLVEDASASRTTQVDSLKVLVGELNWRPGAPARLRVVRWLDNPAIPTRRAVQLSETIVLHSSAPGITPLMRMPSQPTSDQRAEVAARFAAVWGVASKDESDLFGRAWRDARLALDAVPAPSTSAGSLALAVEYARLNTAAALARAGNTGDAIDELNALHTNFEPQRSIVMPERVRVSAGSEEGRWLLALARAGSSAEAITDVLDRAATDARELGIADARAIASLAVGGASSQIRGAASEAIVRHAAEPAVLLELAAAVADGPQTRAAKELVERVSAVAMPPGDDWVDHAHAALVQAALLAGAGSTGIAEDGRELGRLYRMQAGATQSGSLRVSESVFAAVVAVSSDAAILVPPPPAPASELHRVVASQRVLVAVLVHLAEREGGSAIALRALIKNLDRELGAATHVLEQVLACERAISDLWLVLVQGGTA